MIPATKGISMKNKISFLLLSGLLVAVCAISFASCKCEHIWLEADCTTPKTCSQCEETDGAALGHSWDDATCTVAKTCSVCKLTEGDALGHSFSDATCTEPKTCSVCELTEGDALGHSFSDATCTEPKTCSVCELTEGDALGHSYEESVAQKATSTKKGTLKYTCSVCSDSYTEEYSAPVYSAEEIYGIAENSVGEITVYDEDGNAVALGTAFVISEDGRMVTNYHVIAGAHSAKVVIANDTFDVQYVLAYDKEIDIAVIRISITSSTPLTLHSEGVKGGMPVYAVGSSEGYTLSFSTGVVASPDREINGVHYIQHEAAISHGNSGGPLFNKYGEVIGINTMTNIEGQNLNFALPVSYIDKLSYGEKLTMEEFYEKENAAFIALKDHIVKNGEYDKENEYYCIYLDSEYLSDLVLERYVYYYPDSEEIELCSYLNDLIAISVYIDKGDCEYLWCYFDVDDNYVEGILDAATYTDSTYPEITYNEITDANFLAQVWTLSSAVIYNMWDHFDGDFADAGVTSEDFGFSIFN